MLAKVWRMEIRRYQARDRAAVREIACDTADSGQPVERFFPDREVFADVLTRYYTDIAPEATWVAEHDGQVVGYLTGCLDTRRFIRTMAWRIVPPAFLKALSHGTLWHRFIRENLHLPARGGFERRQLFADYPAHLHLNLRSDCRHRGIGRQLLEQFLRQAPVAGVHAGVSETNAAGRQFFEKSGFTELGREPRWGGGQTILYGKRLFP